MILNNLFTKDIIENVNLFLLLKFGFSAKNGNINY